MKIRLKLARIGMNMEEGTIAKWHVAVGADFEAGDALYEVCLLYTSDAADE